MNKRSSVLLMDEDAETLEQLQTMLQREQYHVLAAVDGHAGLRLARTAHPDLIVSDLLLADLDGYEVWKILRADKETAHIPILVTSALIIPRNEPWRPAPDTDWQLLSYDAFLPKPIDLHRFMRVTQKLLLPPAQTQAIPGGPSILLAIEDLHLQDDLAVMLREHDFGVKTSTSLDQALRLARAVPPAALIVDYRHPNEQLTKTIAQIKKLAPPALIILLVDPEQPDLVPSTSCDGLLSTPLHPLITVANLNRILDLCSMHQRTQALSTQLILTNRNLRDVQHMLKAQNQELEYTNTRLRELDNIKQMFSSMIVHDLKSPLGAMLGALNFLQTDPDSALNSLNQYLVTGAVAAGNQMLRLIQTLLERQRLEDGHMKPDAEPFDLARVVNICVQQIASLYTIHRLKMIQHIPDDLPLIYADPHITQRILENLLDNAIKFSPQNGTISITAAANDRFITISVADEGPGIPKEQQGKIFQRFTQLENILPGSPRSGFGLGLTFCYLATQAMAGSIWVESDGVSGTTFLFTLPVYTED